MSLLNVMNNFLPSLPLQVQPTMAEQLIHGQSVLPCIAWSPGNIRSLEKLCREHTTRCEPQVASLLPFPFTCRIDSQRSRSLLWDRSPTIRWKYPATRAPSLPTWCRGCSTKVLLAAVFLINPMWSLCLGRCACCVNCGVVCAFLADPGDRMTLQAAAVHPWVAGAEGPVPEFVCRCGFGRRNRNDSQEAVQ